MSDMKRLSIIYHSQTGNTEMLAAAAYSAALAVSHEDEQNSDVRYLQAKDAELSDLVEADALIIATPENFGYMSGMTKDFFDRTFYPAEPYQLSLPYGLIISAGNDGTGAVREVDRILLGYPMKKVVEPLIVKGTPTASDIANAKEFGAALMTAVLLGAF